MRCASPLLRILSSTQSSAPIHQSTQSLSIFFFYFNLLASPFLQRAGVFLAIVCSLLHFLERHYLVLVHILEGHTIEEKETGSCGVLL